MQKARTRRPAPALNPARIGAKKGTIGAEKDPMSAGTDTAHGLIRPDERAYLPGLAGAETGAEPFIPEKTELLVPEARR